MSTNNKKPVTGWRKIIADWLGIQTVQMPEKTPVYINGGNRVQFSVVPLTKDQIRVDRHIKYEQEIPAARTKPPRTPRKIMTLAQRNRIQSMKTGASAERFYALIGCGDRNALGSEHVERCVAIWSGIIAHNKSIRFNRHGQEWRLIIVGKVQTDMGVKIMEIKQKKFRSYDEAHAFSNEILAVHREKVKADEWMKKYPPAATVASSYWK
jgi:hypothetical protein